MERAHPGLRQSVHGGRIQGPGDTPTDTEPEPDQDELSLPNHAVPPPIAPREKIHLSGTLAATTNSRSSR